MTENLVSIETACVFFVLSRSMIAVQTRSPPSRDATKDDLWYTLVSVVSLQ
jgi:hypothetical protein